MIGCFINKVILFFIFFLLIIPSSYSQKGTDAFEFTGGMGRITQNHPDFPDINTDAITLSLTYSRHFNGYKPWHRFYNFPRVGINLTQGIASNKEVLGSFTGLMSEMTFEKQLGKKWMWAPRLCFGAAWFQNPHNEESNNTNIIVGSDLTFLASADVVLGYKVNSSVTIISRFSLLHASNAHFSLPNVGMNMPLFAMGARYTFKNDKQVPLEEMYLPEFKKLRFNFRVALGINESGSSTGPVNGPKYPVYLASATVSKMFSPVNKVSAGIEGWYNRGVYDFIVSQEFYDENRHLKSSSLAIVLGHEFLFGRWGFVTTAGIYLYNPFYKDRLVENEIDGLKSKLKSYIPARIGMQYYLKNTNFNDNQNLFLGVYVKTNFGQADFFESSIGWVF